MNREGNIYHFRHEKEGDIYQGTSVTLKKGLYHFECWGAQGGTGCMNGNNVYHGGKGAYTSGFIVLNSSTKFYIYVGTKGNDGICSKNNKAIGGENGGGNSGIETADDDCSGGGGGASDIRLVGGNWNDLESLKNRIMVAAGGSGSAFNAYGAPGGSINGLKPNKNAQYSYIDSDTSQTNGNAFGIGCQGIDSNLQPSSGGGGGYYGGTNGIVDSSSNMNGHLSVSSSGSSFVSGFPDCIAIKNTDDDTIEAADSNIHYSGAFFSNPIIISGDKYIPLPDGTYGIGNPNDGYVKITLLLKNINLNTCNHNSKQTFILIIFIYIIIRI